MSLKPLRQVQETNIDFITPWTQERGGCLSIVLSSGMYIAEYAHDPSGLFPMGVQLNDVEWMNLGRQYHRTYSHPAATTDVPCSIVGIATQGDFVTDWLHIVGTIMPGDPAYSGPSGTFTNSPVFGGSQVGKFISTLQEDPHTVVMRGLGFSMEYIDPCDKQLKWENNPADAVHVVTPGYAKIRISI